jgi:hypothetical protein
MRAKPQKFKVQDRDSAFVRFEALARRMFSISKKEVEAEQAKPETIQPASKKRAGAG